MDRTIFIPFEAGTQARLILDPPKVSDPETRKLDSELQKTKENQGELKDMEEEIYEELKVDHEKSKSVAKNLQSTTEALESLNSRVRQLSNQETKSLMKINILGQMASKLDNAKLKAEKLKKETQKNQSMKKKDKQERKAALKDRRAMTRLALDYSRYQEYKKGLDNYNRRLNERKENKQHRESNEKIQQINKRRNKLSIQYSENMVRLQASLGSYNNVKQIKVRLNNQTKQRITEIKRKEREILQKMEEEQVLFKKMKKIKNVEKRLEKRYQSLTKITPQSQRKLPMIKRKVQKVTMKNDSYVFERKNNESYFNASQTTALENSNVEPKKDSDEAQEDYKNNVKLIGKIEEELKSVDKKDHDSKKYDNLEDNHRSIKSQNDREKAEDDRLDDKQVLDHEGYDKEKIAVGGQAI